MPPSPQRPNLLYIHSDQHNPYVMGCAGDRVVETPNLDRLAAEGVRCTQVYCPSPVCVASRMAMLAGRYPSDIEVWTNNQILDSGVPTMAHAMGAAGYRPVLVGRMHAIGPDQLHGYVDRPVGDHCSNWPGSGLAPAIGGSNLQQAGPGQSAYQVHDEDVTAAAEYFLNQLGVRKRAAEVVDPFSLSVGFMLPHSPYLARRHLYDYYRERIGPPAVRQPFGDHLHPAMRWWRSHVDLHDVPEEWVLNGRAAYWALVAAMDAMIGRILNALRENGLADNTLVVYSSDHGDLVGEHDLWMKRTFYEESVKVPAILSWPGVLPCGSECHRVMSALDLNAAMLQALGAPALPNSPGRPALELLRTGAGAWEDLAFSEYALREGQVQRMVRRGRWKLIYHWKERPQLFNLDEDPREREDRAADPECREMVDELTALVLEGWDPARVAARLQARQADVDLIRRWAEKTGAPDKFRWEQRPGMTFREPRSG
jgi:choline-sulfatase